MVLLPQYETCELCKNFIETGFTDGISRRNCPQQALEDFEFFLRHSKTHDKKPHQGNGAPSGAFAFTLTKSPNDPLSVGDMLTAVRKVMAQKSCPVIKYAWYYEEKGRDENGDAIHPHIHGMYETESGGKIEKKHWKRAWSIWEPDKAQGAGFRGGYHRPVRADEAYANYIKKDGGMSESHGCS